MSGGEQKVKQAKTCRDDYFARLEIVAQLWSVWLFVLIALSALIFLALFRNCSSTENVVIVYAAQDQVYAEPILQEFTRQTGIKVRTVFDSEAVKTVGLAQRLLQERPRPQCDLFWGNEELRTRQLAAQGVFRQTNGWAAMGYRSRRIVINTNRVSLGQAPVSLLELTNRTWRGKVALAYPLFGTTATHFLALRQLWGESNWLEWCRALAANQPFLVDGNSLVVQLVGRGEARIGLTDSDDVAVVVRQGLPVAALPLEMNSPSPQPSPHPMGRGSEMLLIPNTVGVIRGAPHPEAAEKLFVYLQRAEVVEKLVAARALEGHAMPASGLHPNSLNWEQILRDLPAATANLNRIFLR